MTRRYKSARSYPLPPQTLPVAPKPTRRTERRFKFPVPIVLVAFGTGEQLFQEVAVTSNVSAHGVCFHLDREPAPESPVALSLVPRRSSSSPNPPHILCEIVWTRAACPGWEVGARVLGDSSVLQLAFPPPADSEA